jgi:hypothetical protein
MTITPTIPWTQRTIPIDWPCTVRDCDHRACELTLKPRCHPAAALDVIYAKARGVLVVRCERCTKLVAEVLVAP